MHVVSSTTVCARAKAPGILDLLTKHPSSKRGLFEDTFCPACLKTLSKLSIEPEEARQKAEEYREKKGYHGPLTPSDLRSLGQLQEANSNQEQREEGSRRSSTSSTCTLFPGLDPHKLAVEPRFDPAFQTGLPAQRKVSEADIGSQPLVFDGGLGVAEIDEFGNAVEGEGGIKRPLPAFLYPYADDFELGDLGRPQLSSENPMQAVETEGRRGSRPKEEMPRAMPQRTVQVAEYCEVDIARAAREVERKAEEYWGFI